MKTQKGEYVPHWWQTVARVERFWAGRILVLCELPENEKDFSSYKLRSDRRLLGGAWTPLFGWHGFGLAPQPKPKAASRALPKAAAAPTALPPKAAPAPSKERWSSFKRKLTWKPIRRNGPNVAAVKQFLLKSGKPASNSRKALKKWETSLLPGSLQTRYTYDVDRNFFERGGPRLVEALIYLFSLRTLLKSFTPHFSRLSLLRVLGFGKESCFFFRSFVLSRPQLPLAYSGSTYSADIRAIRHHSL